MSQCCAARDEFVGFGASLFLILFKFHSYRFALCLHSNCRIHSYFVFTLSISSYIHRKRVEKNLCGKI